MLSNLDSCLLKEAIWCLWKLLFQGSNYFSLSFTTSLLLEVPLWQTCQPGAQSWLCQERQNLWAMSLDWGQEARNQTGGSIRSLCAGRLRSGCASATLWPESRRAPPQPPCGEPAVGAVAWEVLWTQGRSLDSFWSAAVVSAVAEDQSSGSLTGKVVCIDISVLGKETYCCIIGVVLVDGKLDANKRSGDNKWNIWHWTSVVSRIIWSTDFNWSRSKSANFIVSFYCFVVQCIANLTSYFFPYLCTGPFFLAIDRVVYGRTQRTADCCDYLNNRTHIQ